MSNQNETGIFAEERKRRIVAYVNKKLRVTVAELCQEFAMSPATIRNDLNEVCEKGLLKRTHGGAIANVQAVFELTSQEKEDRFSEEKKAIARKALKYIHEGDCIALDAGSTVFELAKLLGQFKKLRVVTYDLSIAAYLDMNTEVSLYITGGEVRSGHHYMTGNTAQQALEHLNVDTFFIAANGFHLEKGITTPQPETAVLKEMILKNARHNILLADSSKVDNVSFVRFADAKKLDVFVTDPYIDSEQADLIREHGIAVDIAQIEEE